MQKIETNKKQGISPLVAAVTGVVLGVGLTAGGAVALRDKKNREKVKKVLGNVKDNAQGYLKDMRKTTDEKVKEKLVDDKKEAKKLKKPIKKIIDKNTKKHLN